MDDEKSTDMVEERAATPPHEPQDWFLASLVRSVNAQPTMEVAITLNVAGLLVSGSLVSGRQFFDGIAAALEASASPDQAGIATISESFRQVGDIYNYADDQPAVTHIHLKNARFYPSTDGPLPDQDGIWWRGRLSEVGGFCLGSFSRRGR